MNKPIKTVWLCGAASPKVFKEALDFAYDVGKALAAANIKMVFGGGNTGVMGAAAEGVKAGGGKMLGVTTQHLQNIESVLQPDAVIHNDYHDVVVETMSVRKEIQLAMADAHLILPGGVGTLDELFDVLTLAVIKYEAKPIIVVDPTDDQRFASVVQNVLQTLPALGVITYDPNTLITYVKTVEELMKILKPSNDFVEAGDIVRITDNKQPPTIRMLIVHDDMILKGLKVGDSTEYEAETIFQIIKPDGTVYE